MFTEAERLRAIELYFKYGRKLAPVVHELGYPSKRNLRRWIRLWDASDCATEAIRRKPRYSDVRKQDAVEHYLTTATARRLPAGLSVIPAVMYRFAGLMKVIPSGGLSST